MRRRAMAKICLLAAGTFYCFYALACGGMDYLSHEQDRAVDLVRIVLGGFGTPFCFYVLRRQIQIYRKGQDK